MIFHSYHINIFGLILQENGADLSVQQWTNLFLFKNYLRLTLNINKKLFDIVFWTLY